MKSYIGWLMLDEDSELWTRGWLPESSILVYSLAKALRTEGVFESTGEAYDNADHADFKHGYVFVNEDGEYEFSETVVEDGVQATVAVLSDFS